MAGSGGTRATGRTAGRAAWRWALAAQRELAYRLLGALVGARRLLFVLVGGGGFAVWLALVHHAAGTERLDRWFAVVAVAALLLFAGRTLVDLPPGVVFRPDDARAGGPPERASRCLASALFDTERGARWRLLARASVTIGRDGTLFVVSPPPLGSGRAVELAFPSRGLADDVAAAAGTAAGDLARQPEALDANRWRGTYPSAASYAAARGELAIPRGVLASAASGWQYARLRRWPALRLTYQEAPDVPASAYLAFSAAEQRDWLRGQLAR